MTDQKTQELKSSSIMKAFSSIINRFRFLPGIGQQYGGDRDMYQALGYKVELEYQDYWNKYLRQDIAKAVIARPVDTTWRGAFKVVESEEGGKTEFEEAWDDLDRKFKLSSNVFNRLDKLSMIGRYGALLFGFNDVTDVLDFRIPVERNLELLYVKPLSEGSADIKTFDEDTTSERFLFPKMYDISIGGLGQDTQQAKTDSFIAHHSRILHVVPELLESEIYGTPILESIFNRLMDLEKLVGSSAEMFWRGARPGYQGKVDENYQLTPEIEEEFKAQLDEYEHNLRRFLVNEGIEFKELGTQVSDPTNHFEIQMQLISSVTGIPKRILTGSERGDLASSQDRDNWFEKIESRRELYAEPMIVRPFIEKMIEHGILPKPEDGYFIVWKDLASMGMKEQAEIGETRSRTLKNYTSTLGSMDVLPLAVFYKEMLGLDKDQVDMILEVVEQNVLDDIRDDADEEGLSD